MERGVSSPETAGQRATCGEGGFHLTEEVFDLPYQLLLIYGYLEIHQVLATLAERIHGLHCLIL